MNRWTYLLLEYVSCLDVPEDRSQHVLMFLNPLPGKILYLPMLSKDLVRSVLSIEQNDLSPPSVAALDQYSFPQNIDRSSYLLQIMILLGVRFLHEKLHSKSLCGFR